MMDAMAMPPPLALGACFLITARALLYLGLLFLPQFLKYGHCYYVENLIVYLEPILEGGKMLFRKSRILHAVKIKTVL